MMMSSPTDLNITASSPSVKNGSIVKMTSTAMPSNSSIEKIGWTTESMNVCRRMTQMRYMLVFLSAEPVGAAGTSLDSSIGTPDCMAGRHQCKGAGRGQRGIGNRRTCCSVTSIWRYVSAGPIGIASQTCASNP